MIKKNILRILLLFLQIFVAYNIYAQQQTIFTGSITDESGESVIGATVVVIGTQNGTVTDLDGKFFISANTSDSNAFPFLSWLT